MTTASHGNASHGRANALTMQGNRSTDPMIGNQQAEASAGGQPSGGGWHRRLAGDPGGYPRNPAPVRERVRLVRFSGSKSDPALGREIETSASLPGRGEGLR